LLLDPAECEGRLTGYEHEKNRFDQPRSIRRIQLFGGLDAVMTEAVPGLGSTEANASS
jgi:hypothetical protein